MEVSFPEPKRLLALRRKSLEVKAEAEIGKTSVSPGNQPGLVEEPPYHRYASIANKYSKRIESPSF